MIKNKFSQPVPVRLTKANQRGVERLAESMKWESKYGARNKFFNEAISRYLVKISKRTATV